MQIVLIGSGNVATVLGRLFKHAGHKIVQVISRDITHAHVLAAELGAIASDFKTMPEDNSDVVIFTVSDDVLYNNSHHFIIKDKLVLHTAGAASKEILQKFSTRYGVLYPLQSIKKEIMPVVDIPFLIDGNTEEVIHEVSQLALSISNTVSRETDEKRLVLHTAAVMVNNFTNHLYTLAEDLCKQEGVDFNLLKPLIMETAKRIHEHSPSELQTGPALRKDIHTLDKHLRLLSAYPKIRTMYLRITDSIMNP
ncbi:MAG: Rossmann-like and DUF2520 domain-containing protein [Ferruginibacter sp.]